MLRLVVILSVWLGAAALLVWWIRPDVLQQPPGWPTGAADHEGLSSSVERLNASLTRAGSAVKAETPVSAEDLLILRRVSLALTGSIPSLEEIRLLESREPGGRIDEYVEHLLGQRRTSDYLAERFARMLVGDETGPFLLFRRRRFVSWISDELHQGRPYDQIVRSMVDSRGVWTSNPATNFVTSAVIGEGEPRPDVNQLSVRVCRAFLGVRLDCAQCHDHPFDDRWKQVDFQRLAAYFGRTGFGKDLQALRGIQDSLPLVEQVDHKSGESRAVDPAVPFDGELRPAVGDDRAQFAAWLTARDNRAFSRSAVNRFWHLMFGRPLVEPIDDIPLDDSIPEALNVLAEDFASHDFDWKRLIRVIARSDSFRAPSRTDEMLVGDGNWNLFPLTPLRGEQIVGSLLQAASLKTLDHHSHFLIRLSQTIQTGEFLTRYGDPGGRELEPQSGTIPQRLLVMNGTLVHDRTKNDFVANAASRIGALAPDDEAAIETALLCVLTRRPTATERTHLVEGLRDLTDTAREAYLSDIVWALVNSTEFSLNH